MNTVRIVIMVSFLLTSFICSNTFASGKWNHSDTLLMQAIKAITRQERSLQNIRIHAETTTFNCEITDASLSKRLEATRPLNVVKLVAIYGGMPWGKCKIFANLQICQGGPIPDYSTRFSAGYNGRVGTYLQWTAGFPKKQIPLCRGEIGGRMPVQISSMNCESGWINSIYGFTSDMPYGYHPRFSAYIRPGQKAVTIDAHWFSLNGKKYLRVSRIGDPLGKEVFLLSPRTMYSIAGYYRYGWRAKKNPAGRIYLVPGIRVKNEFKVFGFYETSAGIFYPKRIKRTAFTYNKDGKKKLFFSSETDISKVRVNDPKVNDATYVVRFPRNAIVTDTATNMTIRIGGTLHQQIKDIEKAVNQARKAIATEPAASRP